MYRISKEFNIAMGHRLSKHQGACKNIHGHNYRIIIGLKSESLDDNGMVMDFSEVKYITESYLKQIDHSFMINKDDELIDKNEMCKHFEIFQVPFEPTAENMSRNLYKYIERKLPDNVFMDFVTIYETDTSSATYSKD